MKICKRGHNYDGKRCGECRRICGKALYWKNREQRLAYFSEWKAKNKDRIKELKKPLSRLTNRRNSLKAKFGLTLDAYDEMLNAQEGVCAICCKEERVIDTKTGQPRALAVDHNHDTGVVRGLLCTGCNQGIGNLKEDVGSILRAARYIQAYEGHV